MISYSDALRTNREKIMTLPMKLFFVQGMAVSKVEWEKKHNPFFPSLTDLRYRECSRKSPTPLLLQISIALVTNFNGVCSSALISKVGG